MSSANLMLRLACAAVHYTQTFTSDLFQNISYSLLPRIWSLWLPADGHILWPKYVGAVDNKYCSKSWK